MQLAQIKIADLAVTVVDAGINSVARFVERDSFKYNSVYGGNLVKRQAIIDAIGRSTVAEVAALPVCQRIKLMQVVGQELRRYHGTAKGRVSKEPLPQLDFTPNRNPRIVARSYRESLTRALASLKAGVAQRKVAPAQAA